MISETLNSLARHFDGWAALGGIHLDLAMCKTLSATLHASTDDVARLEALPVPPELRGTVVHLAAEREARRPLLVAASEGGAA